VARPEKIRLGDLLVGQVVITDEQLKLALEEQKRSGRKLGRVLVESGYATEEGISKALARQLGAEFVDLKAFNPRPELVKLLPEAQARRSSPSWRERHSRWMCSLSRPASSIPATRAP
jgi:MSHA biogenesis protein MshE